MKILHLNYSRTGGAGIAASRIVTALNHEGDANEFLFVHPYEKNVARITWIEKKFNGLQNIVLQWIIQSNSINIFPTRLLKIINQSDADIVHLHWINAEMLAIEQVPKINKPVVWTFHDMWPFCGGEHLTTDNRYVEGYPDSQLLTKSDKLYRWVFKRKQKHWKNLNLQIVCPSIWMADCARESALFSGYPVTVIPNCLDLNVFKPLNQKEKLRKKYKLPLNKKVILFGAYYPTQAWKGGDLLDEALDRLGGRYDFVLAVFGTQQRQHIVSENGLDVYELGFFHSDETLAELYNVADVMCVPSRQEAFGQTASEALSCGTPVVCFNVTGLKDIVDHKINGYLVEPYSPEDYCAGMQWALDIVSQKNLEITQDTLRENCRKKVETFFSEDRVAKGYVKIYGKAVQTNRGTP